MKFILVYDVYNGAVLQMTLGALLDENFSSNHFQMTSRPPLTAIRAFDAVSRHQSFQRAADELGVTPTAISHQIRLLESRTDVRLFERGPAGVKHTAKGKLFANDLGPAMDQIDRAFHKLTQSSDRKHVVLGAGPIIASRWLAPRLPDFSARHPDIDLQLINSPTEIWRRAREFDLAIAWGEGNWQNLHAEKLLDVSLVPVLAPQLAQELDLREPGDLLHAPLLHHRDEREWADWFALAGVHHPVPVGTKVEDTNVVVQAALAGTGVMLGIREFLADDISSNRLICPFPMPLELRAAYFLVTSQDFQSPAQATLSNWLRDCANRRGG